MRAKLLLRQLTALQVKRALAGGDGFAMLVALIAALIVTGAMVLEISRSASSMKVSIQTSDARKAQEAAEFGLNAMMDQLNNNENHYLLVTKLANAGGTGDWQSVTDTNLVNCNITLPTAAASANRIPGVSTNSSNPSVALPNDTETSYSLVGFEPPVTVGTVPSGCDMFGALLGGQARLTVRGTVTREGKVRASHDLVRFVNVRTNTQIVANNMGLVITGNPSASKLGSPFHVHYDQNGDGAIDMSGSTVTETLGNVNCILCLTPSDLDTGGSTFSSVITGPIPGFPTFPSLPAELVSVPAVDLNTSKSNYPFTGTGNTGALEPECRYLTVGGVANAEIGCRFNKVSLGGGKNVFVRADGVPVNLFVNGKFVISGSGSLEVTDGDAATPAADDRNNLWKNLRVFGKAGTPNGSAGNCNQEVTMSGGGIANGARLWFPLGDAKISGSSLGTVDHFGSLWTCIFNQGSGNAGFLIPTNLVQTVAGAGGGTYVYRAVGAF